MIGACSPKPVEIKASDDFRQIPTPIGSSVLIAFDPGGTTGWSRMILPDNPFELKLQEILQQGVWEHGHIDCLMDIDAGAYLMTKMCSQYPYAAIVSESFYLRQMAVDLAPVELISVVRHHLWRSTYKRELHTQQASQGKRITDDRLKELGAYTSQGGLHHARDADRHLIMILRRCMDTNGKEFRRKLWPWLYG